MTRDEDLGLRQALAIEEPDEPERGLWDEEAR